MALKRGYSLLPPSIQKALSGAVQRPVKPRVLPPGAMSPPPPMPASGPYQGAAGSEAQNPGRPRVPQPDWANPSSSNYERRNYYQLPDGTIVAREPGYYNPDNPFDTGRPGERNKELGPWDPSYERRMDEPGITPWGPGGKASAPGAFPSPPGAASAAGVKRPVRNPLLDTLLAGPSSPVNVSGPWRGEGDPSQALMLALADLYKRLPGMTPGAA